ncbi:MAG: Ig-like domain-containing protein [Candidatus Sumerlaeia bacterium]|nr:Ig-like domain-containing protein [Candidatus Sumerlaeia bacterium]
MGTLASSGARAFALAVVAACALEGVALGQGFPNVPRTPGELLAGPIAPEQGRTAIIAWHGDYLVTVPEPPGSQFGADVQMRVMDISDLSNIQVAVLPATSFGFNAHGYFQTGEYLFVGPHCLDSNNQPCNGSDNLYRDALRIGGPGTPIGFSNLTRSTMEMDAGIPVGTYDRSGAQSPWGARMYWSYGAVEGNAFLSVRRTVGEWLHDWGNGGAPTGPALEASWDHLGQTGVIGMPFIMGNILIYASDQTGTGVATYDISDPTNPVLLDVLKEENPGGYWPEVYGHYIFFPRRDGEGGVGSSAGYMIVDFSDPTNLQVVADRNVPGSNQYVTFQDEYAFMNNYKIDMRTFDVVLTLPTVPGLIDASQFALPLGNLVITGGYGTDGPGAAVFAHQSEPDTRSPFVAYHIPRPDQTNYSVYCPITLSIPETLRTETIMNGSSLILRPVGGSPLPIYHSFSEGKLLTVTPVSPLDPSTTYEVVLTSAIEDAAGNGLEPYTFRFSTGSNLAGGNQPPQIGAIAATPAPAAPGSPVDFAWSGIDPDSLSIEYRVDFGDGSPRTGWSTQTTASHPYAAEGHFSVTVQARDPEGAVSARTRLISVVQPFTPSGATASSHLALDAAADRLYVVNPDTDTVAAVDTATEALLWEAPVAGDPRSVALAGDGTVWVACHDGDAVDVLAASTGALLERIALPYGSRPVGIAQVPGAGAMLVSCEGDGTLRRFGAASRTETGALALGASPRAIAVTGDGGRALVTRFVSGRYEGSVYDVALAGPMSLTRTIRLAKDYSQDGAASGRGVPNYLAAVRITPDGGHAWVVGKKDNTQRGTFSAANLPLGQDNTVRAQLMVIDLSTNQEDVSLRLDIDNSDSPAGIAFSPLGDYAFLALQGNNQVAVVDVLDFMRPETPGTVRTRWGTGLAPQGVELHPATGRLFTADFMDRTATRLDISQYLAAGSGNIPEASIATAGAERLHPMVLQGKRVFYNASDPRMSAEGYISCATCHVDGSHDGRTYDFTNRGEGFRNTTDLRGRSGTFHGAVHWSANFDEIQDFENDIRNDFGGAGFMDDADFTSLMATLGAPKAGASADLDALAAYVASLGTASIPRSTARNTNGTLSAAALRGADVFAANNCASCHTPGADYTDRATHNVGTLRASSGQRLGGPLTAIDTPTLLGLHDAAPYLHNGTAATLAEVFSTTGGRLAQANEGALAGGATYETVNWITQKEWHQNGFVVFYGAASITFGDVSSAVGGPGYIELRYNASYGQGMFSLAINGGAPTNVVMPQSPNSPSWYPNEWRTHRVPVVFQAGSNTVVISGGVSGGELKIDDILFSTPDDAALAAAHTSVPPADVADLVEYLLSLDGTNAALPGVTVARGGAVALGGTDTVAVTSGSGDVPLLYTIANPGSGPLNLGQFHIESTPPGSVALAAHPAPQVLPAGSTQLELLVLDAYANQPTATITAWSDAPGASPVEWTIQVNRANASVGDGWMMY